MIARNAKIDDLVWRETDNGNILQMGKITDIDAGSNMVKVLWNHNNGWTVWEDASDLDLRPRVTDPDWLAKEVARAQARSTQVPDHAKPTFFGKVKP